MIRYRRAVKISGTQTKKFLPEDNPYTMMRRLRRLPDAGLRWTSMQTSSLRVLPGAIVGNFDVAVIKRSPAPAVRGQYGLRPFCCSVPPAPLVPRG